MPSLGNAMAFADSKICSLPTAPTAETTSHALNFSCDYKIIHAHDPDIMDLTEYDSYGASEVSVTLKDLKEEHETASYRFTVKLERVKKNFSALDITLKTFLLNFYHQAYHPILRCLALLSHQL